MSAWERFRAWLRGGSAVPGPLAASGPGRGRRATRSRRAASVDPSLGEFAASRTGVEAYLEPRTAVHPLTLLLVAGDGEVLRRPVPDRASVERFCADRAVPLYDASRVGYPRRIRDFERGAGPRPVDLTDLPPWPGPDADPDPTREGADPPAG